MVLGGGEANQPLLDLVSKQLDLKCELSDPFRSLSTTANLGRRGQWDVAMGLAMRELN
jgi:Tfp pilus assembly PilM family ATPase